jgi:carbonic anhydrase
MIKITLALVAAATLSFANSHEASHAKAHWDYDQHGPAHWGEFSSTCKVGKSQSPIDIKSDSTIKLDSSNVLMLDEDRNTIATVVDNGHGIVVTPKNGGKITLNGVEYKLLQFHFHGKSENKINGVQYDLEMHMVHQSSEGKLAVIAVLYLEGDNNPLLDNVLGSVGQEIRVNPNDLLPENTKRYYHWKGSLTTPPCSEDVEWYLMKESQSASADQIKEFRKYYDHNFRPTQPLNGRKVQVH